MELRSCTNLHFIQAVNSGLVIKTLNVNRGKPVLKLKNLKDIYEAEDSKNQRLFLEPKDEFEEIHFNISKVKVERPSSDDNDGSDSDLDVLGSSKMTLKQIKENCKAKKRKLQEFIESRSEELCKQVKQEIVKDECGLNQPLITWKSKHSKKSKNKHGSLSVIKAEQESFSTPMKIKVEPDCLDTANAISFDCDSSLIYDNQVDSCGDSQNSKEVTEIVAECDRGNLSLCSDSQNPREETETVAECDQEHQASSSDSQNPRESTEIAAEYDWGTQELCLESQTAICFSGSSSLICGNQAGSCGIVPGEVTKTATKCDWGTKALISLAKGPQHFVRVAYPESMEHSNSDIVEIVDDQDDSCRTVRREVIEIATEAVSETDKSIPLVEDPQCCVMNEVCYEYVDHAYSNPLPIVSISCDYIKEVDIPEINIDQCSDLPVLESKGEVYVDQPLCADTSRETIFPISNGSSEIFDYFPSPTDEEIPCHIDSKEVQISYVGIHDCLQFTESSHGSDACAPNGNAQDDLLSNFETGALHSLDGTCSLDPESWFSPCADGSPMTEEKQSQSSTPADSGHCSSETPHQNACEELTASDDGDYYSKLKFAPQRLLSTRKAISPDSQEKLCKAMESIELQEEEHHKPQKELFFGQQTKEETKINTAERSAKISRIRFTANQKQNTEKSKNEKRHNPTEGISKGTHLSHAVPRFSTGCNSIEVCSQSAIAFSQRQMQDIECLATKLINELKTMKEIAEDRLYSEASPATSLRYKANEVRIAIKNATKVEQLANRWLSMMARDCNRFCKIMRLAEKDFDAPESESVVNKERKKITFADEAGEELCHVRLIENKLTSSLEPDTEKPQALN